MRALGGRNVARPAAPGSLRRCRRAVFAIPDARPDSAARAASIASTGSDLPCMAAHLTVGAINFDHDQPARLQIARQARAIRAGAFDTDTSDRTERATASRAAATNPPVLVGNDSTPSTPPFASSAAATCTSRWVSTPPVIGRDAIYDGHRHPFSLQRSRGGTHVPGRRPCRSACCAGRIDHPPERGVPNSSTVRSTGAPIKRALRQFRSDNAHRRPANREQRQTQSHWQLWRCDLQVVDAFLAPFSRPTAVSPQCPLHGPEQERSDDEDAQNDCPADTSYPVDAPLPMLKRSPVAPESSARQAQSNASHEAVRLRRSIQPYGSTRTRYDHSAPEGRAVPIGN